MLSSRSGDAADLGRSCVFPCRARELVTAHEVCFEPQFLCAPACRQPTVIYTSSARGLRAPVMRLLYETVGHVANEQPTFGAMDPGASDHTREVKPGSVGAYGKACVLGGGLSWTLST